MKLCFRFLLLFFMLVSLTSCINDDTVDGNITPLYTEIVTFDGNTDDTADFSFNKVDDSPVINLVAGRPVSGDIEPGTRVFLVYQPLSGQGAYESGAIAIRQVSLINNGRIETADIMSLGRWDNDKVYLYSLWRSGDYINIHCRLPYSSEPRRFSLAALDSTVNEEIVDVYLIHELPEPVNSFERAYYASFNIAEIWNRPSCRGIRVHVANSNLEKNIFEINKP